MFSDLARPATDTPRPSNVLLEGVIGTAAYGLDPQLLGEEGPETLGVYAAPTEDFLGLDEPPEDLGSVPTGHVMQELRRFLNTAHRSTAALELLHLEKYQACHRLGVSLIGIRHKLLSAPRVRAAYLGGAQDQLDGLRRGLGERAGRAAVTAARLVKQGLQLWSTGVLTVRLDAPGWYHDVAARAVAGDIEVVEALVEQYALEFDRIPTVLPAMPDRDGVDGWLRGARRDLIFAGG